MSARAPARWEPSAAPAAAAEHFTVAGREWLARRVLNEAGTAMLLRIVPAAKGPPWPSRAEFMAALAAFRGRAGA